MEIDYTHFINTLSPAEKLNQLKMLGELRPALTWVLQEELRFGNIILQVTKGWPEDDSISVSLKKSFSKKYNHPELEYQEINDAHYGKAQYASKGHPTHLLISSE
jgi:hypothetical protein